MIKKEGTVIASLFGASEALRVFSDEGGIIAPEFLNALQGYDLKTLVIIGAVLWYFRKQGDGGRVEFVCPYAPKDKEE